MRQIYAAALALLAASGCKDIEVFNPLSEPTPEEVCKKLFRAEVASNCREETPGGIGAAATKRFDFDLRSVPGKGASILYFDDEGSYTQTVIEYGKRSFISGPHRYGNKKKRIFVQMNAGASEEDARKVKDVLARL